MIKRLLLQVSGHHWQKVVDKYEIIANSFAAVHQRLLNKRKRPGRFGNKQNKRTD